MKKLINCLFLMGTLLIILGLILIVYNKNKEIEIIQQENQDNVQVLKKQNEKLYDKYFYEKLQAEYWYYYNVDDAC